MHRKHLYYRRRHDSPVALFLAGAAFDWLAQWTKRRELADAAYYNLLAAAVSTLPALATGILAWQFQLEGQKLKGILLLHLVLACLSSVLLRVRFEQVLRRPKTAD